MLLLDKQMYDADAAKWWADLAGVDRAAFEKQAADLLALLAVLRQVAAGGVGLLSLVAEPLTQGPSRQQHDCRRQ
jgi:hypothetical protein